MFWYYFDCKELILFIKGNFLGFQHIGDRCHSCILNAGSL